MRIVFLSTAKLPSYSANSIQVMRMCEGFSECGHKVTLVAIRNTYNFGSRFGIDTFYGTKNNFEIKFIKLFGIKGKIVFFGIISAIEAFLLKPDLVYCRNLIGCYFSCLLKCNSVLELHAPPHTINRLSSFVFNNLLKLSSLVSVIVISDKLKQIIVKNYEIDENKIIIAHDGVDVKQEGSVLCRRSSRPMFKCPSVGYVGSLYEGRGIDLIIRLSKIFENVNFYILGEGSEKIANRLKERSGPNLKYLGYINPGEVSDYLSCFDILVAPYDKRVSVSSNHSGSDTSEWMSPLKIFEYMGARKPIISSDHGVIREVLTDKKNAILAEPGSLESWAKALRLLLSNTSLCREIADNAFNDVKAYSWRNRCKKVLGLGLSIK